MPHVPGGTENRESVLVFRYISKEILISLSAVTGVLLLIIVSGRFIKYLSSVAAGELSADVLLVLMAYRIPGFLELILPLGLFLGVLLGCGRLYLESEMVVLSACGMSQRRLQWLVLGPATMVALIVAALSLFVTPWGADQVQQIFIQQDSRTEFDALSARRFQSTPDRQRVIYTQELTDERTRLQEVFIADRGGEGEDARPGLIVAESGSQYRDEGSGSRFLLLENGYRYEGVPGQADYRRVAFQQYGVRLPEPTVREKVARVETLPTGALLASDDPRLVAQWQWRVSLPILCIVVTLMAFPLSRANPRQGRYARLLPSIILYLAYLILLSAARSAVEKGQLPPLIGIWWVHGVFIAVAVFLHLLDSGRLRLSFWSGGRR